MKNVLKIRSVADTFAFELYSFCIQVNVAVKHRAYLASIEIGLQAAETGLIPEALTLLPESSERSQR